MRYKCDFRLLVGSAYARAENEIRDLIESTDLPFLATPMGKGVVSDFDEHSVSSARTIALLQADVILLLGARLNWMLHFGRAPRFHKDVKVIQVFLANRKMIKTNNSYENLKNTVLQIKMDKCSDCNFRLQGRHLRRGTPQFRLIDGRHSCRFGTDRQTFDKITQTKKIHCQKK